MKHYVKFDTEQFLKDSRGWTEKLEALKRELDSITEITGRSEGVPSGGGISNPVERTAIDRDMIQRRIDTIEEYQTCFKYAWESISEADRLILTGFYYAPGYVYQFVELWCAENASNRQYCYTARREAELRFGAACKRWMELHGYET